MSMRKGIYILPNLFTTGNLFFGFLSIMHSWDYTLGQQPDIFKSGLYIMIAAVLDMVDGRVARKTNSGSRFGEEYDSLADLVSFGVAPMMMFNAWGGFAKEELVLTGCFFHIACGAIRLARFNVQAKNIEKSHFQGLPIPMGGMYFVLSMLLFEPYNSIVFGQEARHVILISTFVVPFLMVSQIPYVSSKSFALNRRRSFNMLFPFLFVCMSLWLNPILTLYVLGLTYIASGPVGILYRAIKHNLQRRKK